MLCPVCNHKTRLLYRISHFKKSFNILICDACGLQMQEKYPKEAELFYTKEYYSGKAEYSYQDERSSIKFHNFVWQARLKKLARFLPPPADFLDIGCAFGGFVQAASNFGYRAQGLDLSGYAVDYARSQGLAVRQGELEPGLFPPQSVDIVSLVEVMEHIAEPRRAMEALSEIVRPKGVVLVQTANFLGWQARWAGKNYHYYLPGHLFYYSTKNLRMLFEEYGFGPIYFFRGVDFGLWPKLRKSQGQFSSMWDYLRWLKIAGYHSLSRIAYKDFALSSSMVMYAFKI